jgi:E3 ubiquitin-protein ligase synoviolin
VAEVTEVIAEEVDDDDVARFDDDDVPLREAMAAAALRRVGGLGAVDKGKARAEPEVEAVPEPAVEPPQPSFSDAPTHRAFLTPATTFGGLAFPQAAGSSTPGASTAIALPAALPRTPEAARAALEERLAALRGVDEVVWSLVGELSRLKSAWEVEDGKERDSEADRPVS